MQYTEVSELSISQNGVPVTSFRYVRGVIQVGALSGLTTTYDEHKRASDELNAWLDYLRKRYAPVESAPVPVPHVFRYAREAAGLAQRFVCRGQLVYQATFIFATDGIVLEPRPAITIPWREFVRWREAVTLFLAESRLPTGS